MSFCLAILHSFQSRQKKIRNIQTDVRNVGYNYQVVVCSFKPTNIHSISRVSDVIFLGKHSQKSLHLLRIFL